MASDDLGISPDAADRRAGESSRGVKLSEHVMRSEVLLKTPTTQLAVNGGSQHPDKRKAGGHGPTLADEVEFLIPTPVASDYKGSSTSRRKAGQHRGQLDAFVEGETLLATPTAAIHTGGAPQDSRGKRDLRLDMKNLLPTPRSSDGSKGGPNQRGSSGDLMLPSAVVQRWGDYADAIARWEAVIGRPAPEPTETGPKGSPRLSPRFVEWMMGLHDGHVTGVGLSRVAELKALGNGVVIQQAETAIRYLLDLVDQEVAA